MHNICSGDLQVKNLREEGIFGFVLWSF